MATASVKSPSSINRIVKAFEAKIAEFQKEGTQGMIEHTRILKRVYGSTTNEAAQALCKSIFEGALATGDGIPVGYKQTEQCRVWLLDQYKTPSGLVRKHNPFSQREIDILENFGSVYWTSTRRVNQNNQYRVGVYTVYDRNGNGFEYYLHYTGNGSPVQICN
jgi:hypothetical protein